MYKFMRHFFLMLLCLMTFMCARQEASQQEHSHKPSGLSIFQLNSKWRTQDNQEVELDILNGQVQVLAMVYSSCENVCPRIMADMKKIEQTLEKRKISSVGFALVSIDPERDTPQKLKKLQNESHLKGWTLFTGTETGVRELAAVLGVQYKKISDTDFAHSNVISILNKRGEVFYQQIGLGTNPSHTIDNIAKLVFVQE